MEQKADNENGSWVYVSFNLNSIKKGHIGDNIEEYHRGYQGAY